MRPPEARLYQARVTGHRLLVCKVLARRQLSPLQVEVAPYETVQSHGNRQDRL